MEQQPADQAQAILNAIYTTEDAQEFIERIDTFLADIYSIERKDILTVLDDTFPENISKEIKNYITLTNTSLTHQEEVRVALMKLQQAIRAARTLSLTLAFSPTRKTVIGICERIKQEFGQDVITEISYNPDLVGGAVIVFEGKYTDQSIKKKLTILFEAKENEIRSFLH